MAIINVTERNAEVQAKVQSIVEENVTTITIDSITNTLDDFDDTDNEYTVYQSTDCVGTGTLDYADATFRVPFERIDTGRKVLFAATVVDGEFSVTMNFPTSGEWQVTTDLVNSELSSQTFSIDTLTFKVL